MNCFIAQARSSIFLGWRHTHMVLVFSFSFFCARHLMLKKVRISLFVICCYLHWDLCTLLLFSLLVICSYHVYVWATSWCAIVHCHFWVYFIIFNFGTSWQKIYPLLYLKTSQQTSTIKKNAHRRKNRSHSHGVSLLLWSKAPPHLYFFL